jgi:hypothetical protein
MSGNVTFQELIDQSKDRADMTGSSFVTDPQWKTYINKSKDVLYDHLIGAYGEDYYTTSYDLTLVAGTESYSLPSDFYKLVSVELNIGGSEYIPLNRFSLRNRGRGFYNRYYNVYKYRLLGDNIHFTPNPSTGTTVKLWYIPLATNLSLTTDELKGFNGWEEFIIIDAAIKAMRKEETDSSDLERDRAVLVNRLNAKKRNRDAANPMKVKDTSSRYFYDSDESYEGP